MQRVSLFFIRTEVDCLKKNQNGNTLLLYLIVFQALVVFGGFCFDGVRLIYNDMVLNGSVRHAAVSACSALLQSEELAKDIAVDVLQRNCQQAIVTEMITDGEKITLSAQMHVRLFFMPLVTELKENTITASYTAYPKLE